MLQHSKLGKKPAKWINWLIFRKLRKLYKSSKTVFTLRRHGKIHWTFWNRLLSRIHPFQKMSRSSLFVLGGFEWKSTSEIGPACQFSAWNFQHVGKIEKVDVWDWFWKGFFLGLKCCLIVLDIFERSQKSISAQIQIRHLRKPENKFTQNCHKNHGAQ